MNTHEPRTNERTPAGPGHEASRTVAGAGDISELSHHDLCELKRGIELLRRESEALIEAHVALKQIASDPTAYPALRLIAKTALRKIEELTK